MDENAGTVTYDSSGHGNNGSLQGPAWATGRYGSGLSFNGSDSYVDAGSGSSLDIPDATTSVSVEMWVYVDTQTENYPMPFTKGGYATSVAGYYMGGLADPDRAKMRFGLSDGGETQDDVANSPATVALNDGQWHHLVGYADRTTGKIGIYLDGTLVGENTILTTVGSLSNPSRAATIGGYGTAYSFKGKIDGVRIYKKALSPAEVQARYAAQPEEEATVHYYLGDKEVAFKKGATLNYVHQDHLTGTAVVSDSSGNQVSAIKYMPFGTARSGSVPTDKKFTGQRLDGTGLYYYGARYYDPSIGRFISADTIVPDFKNPQSLNRYTYVLNNPLKYTDPTGHDGEGLDPPDEDGQLGWTVKDGWLESRGGQWVPINSPDDRTPRLPVEPPQPVPTTPPEPSLPIAPSQSIVPEKPEPSLPQPPLPVEPPDPFAPEGYGLPGPREAAATSQTVRKLGVQALGAVIFVATEIPITIMVVASLARGGPIPWGTIEAYERFVWPAQALALWMMAGAPRPRGGN